ncbi:hypothetical protein OCU04_003179 [Sclerotinia nivalis]|uniref:Uncharacterized protein n=1 Tax=Sclerotinia nivalis TaxID=352851 RepID=A0A9X0DN96_9HELO|nr:hypothetical protein OCU04_003179 [Sclerotinia nivalis]
MPTTTNVVTIVALSLMFLIILIILMIYFPAHIGLHLNARRIAARAKRRSAPPTEQQLQDRDIEMNDWPLRYPDPVITTGNHRSDDWPLRNPAPPPAAALASRTRRSEDWPLKTIEPVIVAKRRQFKDPDEDDLKFGGAGGSLEGFPYSVR